MKGGEGSLHHQVYLSPQYPPKTVCGHYTGHEGLFWIIRYRVNWWHLIYGVRQLHTERDTPQQGFLILLQQNVESSESPQVTSNQDFSPAGTLTCSSIRPSLIGSEIAQYHPRPAGGIARSWSHIIQFQAPCTQGHSKKKKNVFLDVGFLSGKRCFKNTLLTAFFKCFYARFLDFF